MRDATIQSPHPGLGRSPSTKNRASVARATLGTLGTLGTRATLVAERLTATGQIVSPGTPAEFAAAIDEQAVRLAAFAGTLGIQARQ